MPALSVSTTNLNTFLVPNFLKIMYFCITNSSKKSLEIIFSWLSGNMLELNQMQSVTSERRYSAMNMVKSQIKFDKT